jgi:2-dehydro-3-deoxyphosphogluconate aldolase/(4S)-4-hydroxy-2-oxoglutarate aldolase
MQQILDTLGKFAVIPVVKIENASDASALGKALLDGGLPCAEITFRTTDAESAIKILSSSYPEMIIGAGTVLSVDQAKTAVLAGAQFIVSPGLNPDVVKWCIDNDIAVTPGVATPTEIEKALGKGLTVLKFFPAQAFGGTKTLKAISSPYSTVKFIPTGGINASNLSEYIQLPMVLACGGSWFVKADLITSQKFDTITRLTEEALAIVQQYRKTAVH